MANFGRGNRVSAAEVQKFLSGMDYPAGKNDLLSHAQEHGAPQDVLEVIQALPEGEYSGVQQVSKGIGEVK